MSRLTDYLADVAAAALVNGGWVPKFDCDDRLRRKLAVFCRLTDDLSRLSTCKRAGVGCVIVSSDLMKVHAVGYNGPAVGESNDLCTREAGNCGCVHAEANAVAKLQTDDRDCVAIVNLVPCLACAGLLVNCLRVVAVVYANEYRDTAGLTRLARAGLTVVDRKDAL